MKKNKNFTTALLIIAFAAGLILVLYPSVANYVNQLHSSRVISGYSESMEKYSAETFDQLFADARVFNEKIPLRENVYVLSDEEKIQYDELLNLMGDGVMGYIEIPSIEVQLPVYHGTDENTLQVAAGHLNWTSLPTGGKGTHCVLSGHRGLPSAKLFTDLDELTEGDVFLLRILNRVFTYEVDQIRVVKPSTSADLQIVEGEDYCTLVTCTPYGINSHRLLVRGHRIDNTEKSDTIRVVSEGIQVNPVIISAILTAVGFTFAQIVFWLLPAKKRRKAKQEMREKAEQQEADKG